MEKSENIKALNKFLKGINMGIVVFDDFIDRSLSKELIEELTSIRKRFNRYKEIIEDNIIYLGGNPKEGIGILGIVSEFMEKIKLLSANDDEEILDNAMNAMGMGIKNSKEFLEENNNIEDKLKKDIEEIISDYEDCLKKLEDVSIEVQRES